MEENLHDGHRKRTKDRFVKEGLSGFADHNKLELLLFYAIPRRDTNELAHRLIKRFGNIADVFNAPITELEKVDGISYNAAVLIKMIPQYASFYLASSLPKNESLENKDKLGGYFVPRFLGMEEENTMLLCLDSALSPINCEIISKGNINSTELDIKSIIKITMKYNCNRVAIAHNHPRGLALPSNNDILATAKLKKGLALLDIELVDHIIVAGNSFFSVKERYPDI